MSCKKENCVFGERPSDDMTSIGWRTIRADELFTSFVSRPWFRPGHCLVIPNRHVVHPGELSFEEGGAIMGEVGRLSLLLDDGFGMGTMQKYQPLQPENEVKANHVHFHVFPRIEDEPGLFPVPAPNAFEGFVVPEVEEILALAQRLR